MPSSSTFRQRFGSLLRAYELVGYSPSRDYRYIETKSGDAVPFSPTGRRSNSSDPRQIPFWSSNHDPLTPMALRAADGENGLAMALDVTSLRCVSSASRSASSLWEYEKKSFATEHPIEPKGNMESGAPPVKLSAKFLPVANGRSASIVTDDGAVKTYSSGSARVSAASMRREILALNARRCCRSSYDGSVMRMG